mmetsp:Transcript_2305/g.3346  ORF Transcript_2305/g.3346 Transcript_2305/m.3346 type:complete len:621 (-) Transcript_2305:205-2067(-)
MRPTLLKLSFYKSESSMPIITTNKQQQQQQEQQQTATASSPALDQTSNDQNDDETSENEPMENNNTTTTTTQATPTETTNGAKLNDADDTKNENETPRHLPGASYLSYPMRLSDEIQSFAEYKSVVDFQSSYLNHLGGNESDDQMDTTTESAVSTLAVSTISVAFSPNAATMASTHGDHTVKITCCQTGRLLATLEGHPRTPWTVKYHPSDPEMLASGCLGFQVIVWNWTKQDMLNRIRLNHSIISLSFHPSGKILAIASGSKLHLWDYQNIAAASASNSSQQSPPPTEQQQNTTRTNDANVSVQLLVARRRRQQQQQQQDGICRSDFDFDDDASAIKLIGLVMSGWVNARLPESAERAHLLLRRCRAMSEKQPHRASDLKPDMIAYTMVVDAYARNYNTEKAIELLAEVRKLEKMGDDKASLTVRFVSSVIRALGNTLHHDILAAKRSVALLNGVIQRYNSNNRNEESKPTIYIFNNVLKCCSSVNGVDEEERQQAFDLTMEVYNKMQFFPDIHPDGYTYNYLLKATTRFVPVQSMRDSIIRATFQECADKGLVNDQIIERVKCNASPMLVDALFLQRGSSTIKLVDLPREWTRHSRPISPNTPRVSKRTKQFYSDLAP